MKNVLVIAFLMIGLKLQAQTSSDTSAMLDSIRISADRLLLNQRLFSEELLKVNPSQSFAELLQKQTGIFIKTSGVGSLNTPSYKGLGTMHIPINIDGANMQSSMNGTMDLSLIDAFHFSQSSFGDQDNQQLGQSNMGSSLQLITGKIKPQVEFNVSGNTQRGQSVGLKYGNLSKKWKYQASFFGNQSENNVSLASYIGEDSLLENNAFQKASLLQSVSYQSPQFGIWKNTIYFQVSERFIPPALQSSSDAKQSDRNFMMLNKYQKQLKRRWSVLAQNQLWKEEIRFQSEARNLSAQNQVWNVNSTVQVAKRFTKKLRVVGGLGNEMATYTATNLEDDVNYNRLRAFYDATFRIKKSRFLLSQQLVMFDANKFSHNASIEGVRGIGKYNQVLLRAQRVYRLPTLNELYWYEPGFASGNLQLNPEEGEKIDLVFSRDTEKLNFSINPFVGWYENLIAWQGFPEISPVNLQSVFIRGVELKTLLTYSVWKGRLAINTNIHYVKSTYNPSDEQDATFGKQLIYTPEITANLTVTYSTDKFGIYLNEQFVGENYVTSDNSNSLESYYLTEVGGYYRFNQLRCGISVSNLFNTAYFTIPNTPLPGRVININANYILKIKTWKKH